MRDAAVYVRISKDDEGESLGVRRQEQDRRALAKRHGWTVAEVYRDNDISAVKYRPGWERMLRDISDGRVGAVVAYSSSRLYRDVDGDKARLFAACMKQDQNGDRVQVETVVSGTIDPYTADGRMLANILASVDAAERERTGERSRRALLGKRERGEWIGRTPYGWRRVGKHLERDEEQQQVLREIARRYIAGESFNAIGKDVGMAPFVLTRMMASERVQEALPDDLAGPLAEALLDRQYRRGTHKNLTLLGGLIRCGVCGGTMHSSSTRGNREGTWRSYRCPQPGHAGIACRWLDEYITEQVLDYIDVPKLLASRKRRAAKTRRVSEIENRLEALDARYVEGKVPQARFDRMNEALLQQLAEAEQAERANGVDLPAELARNLSQNWPTFAIETQRRIIQAVCDSIVVTKATGNGPIDPSRVQINFRA
jgi:site-specific DNA recombinase